MKYRNATEVFPDKLLKEIQKYTSGEILYIPAKEERKNWGTKSGARIYYEQRNEEIRYKYRKEKKSLDELGVEYNLSVETIRKILYR